MLDKAEKPTKNVGKRTKRWRQELREKLGTNAKVHESWKTSSCQLHVQLLSIRVCSCSAKKSSNRIILK